MQYCSQNPSYLESPKPTTQSVTPKWNQDISAMGTKMATAGALKAAYFTCCGPYTTIAVTWNGETPSFTSEDIQWIFPSLSYPRTCEVSEEAWGTAGLTNNIQGKFECNFLQKEHTVRQQKPQVLLFSWLRKQPLGKPFEEYTNSCLFIFYRVSLRAQTFDRKWLPKCFCTFTGKVRECQKVFNVSLHFLQAVSDSVVVRIKRLVSVVWNHF